uniref:TonB family protein n=1 Tax=Solibacter usitatus (strain Ellin6076) TaxID=234267 RepID=Q01X37_SOLUE
MIWMDLAVRGTVVLAMAFVASWMLRNASAAIRHFVWTAAFAAVLLLPAAMRVGPRLAVASTPAAATPSVARATPARVQLPANPARNNQPVRIPWAGFYAAGVLLVMVRFLAGAWRMRTLVQGALPASYAASAAAGVREELEIARAVRVLESDEAHVPMAWGVRRSVVLLPAAARQWPAARLHAVLLHEMVHVVRHDLLAQMVAQAACCLYWFHPLAWIGARQLRKERERACDDAVLNRGITAPDYAGHLMELARVLVERQASLADAPAMAEAGDLEDRVRALLDRGRNRKPLTRGAASAVAAMACVLVLSVTSLAQPGRGALAGIVQDPSGSRVPRSEVTIKNLDGSNEEVTVVNAAGEYAFASIPAGRYAIEVKAGGFKIGKQEVVVTAGAASRADVSLQIGNISESLKVRAARTSPAPPPARALGTPQRIPIGGNVQPSKLITKVNPEYPADLKQQGVTGSVVIRAIISKTGDILNAQVINTVHPGLAQAALDAVKQWRYQPTLLNGQPVEVITTVTIAFELE